MRDTLDHLPRRKQQKLVALAELIRARLEEMRAKAGSA